MSDVSSADRDEHVPGCAGTAEATACCSNVRLWRRDASQPGYECRRISIMNRASFRTTDLKNQCT